MKDLITLQKLVVEIREMVLSKENFTVKFQGLVTLVVAGEIGSFFVSNGRIADLLAMPKLKYSMGSLKKGSEEYQKVQTQGRPVSELLWELAFHSSADELLPGCQRSGVMKLVKWPNLTRVERSDNTIRIANLLINRATSIDLASRILEVDKSEMIRFYNAAHYAGLVETVNHKDSDSNQPISGKGNAIIPKLISYLKRKENRV